MKVLICCLFAYFAVANATFFDLIALLGGKDHDHGYLPVPRAPLPPPMFLGGSGHGHGYLPVPNTPFPPPIMFHQQAGGYGANLIHDTAPRIYKVKIISEPATHSHAQAATASAPPAQLAVNDNNLVHQQSVSSHSEVAPHTIKVINQKAGPTGSYAPEYTHPTHIINVIHSNAASALNANTLPTSTRVIHVIYENNAETAAYTTPAYKAAHATANHVPAQKNGPLYAIPHTRQS